MPMPDEHYILDDNKYVADILQDFKAAKGRDYQSKVLFKKRMFRETDETITEPQFITLSYVQVSSPCALQLPLRPGSSCYAAAVSEMQVFVLGQHAVLIQARRPSFVARAHPRMARE